MTKHDIVTLWDGLFRQKKHRPRSSSTGRVRRAWRSLQAEHLEERSLLTLIGIDFGGGGSTPINWTEYSGTTDTTLSSLIDETGTATSVNVSIDVDNTLQGRIENFQPPAKELPNHTQSLAGVNDAFSDSGNVELSFSGLAENTLYEIYVFAGDVNSSPGSNRVTVTAGSSSLTFEQPHDSNQLVVNADVGDSSRDLSTFAQFITTDAGGTMLVRVDNAPRPTEHFGLAGIALQQSTPGIVRISDKTVNVGAAAIAIPDGSASLTAVDDDVPTLFVTTDLSTVGEADGTASATGTVSRNTATSAALQVMLMSDDTTEIAVVQTVTIPANETSVSFAIDSVDDSVVDGVQTVRIIASATDHLDGAQSIDVSDDDGGVIGQKWHDLNADGLKDADEPGLDGWTIRLLDDAGVVVAQALTESVDVDNDGQINPFTESGLYSVATVAGTWRISEVQQQGWQPTTQAADSQAALLHDLDQQLNLRFTGNYFESWGGLGEKWMQSSDGWHYITPDGNLYQWDTESRTPLLGQLVAQVGPAVHENTALLHDALPPNFAVVTFAAGEIVTGIDFGNIPSGRIEGRNWNDINADHSRTTNEPWLNGWTVHLEDSDGNIVASTVTADVDRDNDGQIDPATETGWYSFDAIVPGDYRVRQVSQPQWGMADAGGQFAHQAYTLDQQLDFRRPVNSFFNWGGLQENWFWSRHESWHYITPDGSLFQWDGSSAESLTGTPVAQFDSQYWERPVLIYDAADPDPFRFSIVGQTLRDVNFGNTFGLDGSGAGNVTVTFRGTTVTVSGDERANSLSIYSDSQGRVVVQGAGSTTVNGSFDPLYVFPFQTGLPGNVIIAMRDGLDQIALFDVVLHASLHVELGGGNDTFLLSNVAVAGDASVTSPRGDAQVRFQDSTIARNLSVFTSGEGNNLTSVQDVAIGQSLFVINSGGADTVFLQGAAVANATNISTGSGADSIIANRARFSGNVLIHSRNGDDLIALLGSEFLGPVHLYAGSGDDVLGNTSGSSFAFNTGFSAGPGNDTSADDGTATYGRTAAFSSFEIEDESSLTNLIDIALSNFDDLLLN